MYTVTRYSIRVQSFKSKLDIVFILRNTLFVGPKGYYFEGSMQTPLSLHATM